jgi:hypothetical protein
MKPGERLTLMISNIIIPVSREQIAQFSSIDKSMGFDRDSLCDHLF